MHELQGKTIALECLFVTTENQALFRSLISEIIPRGKLTLATLRKINHCDNLYRAGMLGNQIVESILI